MNQRNARQVLGALPPLPSFGAILGNWWGHQLCVWLLLLLMAL